jgi:hypothetical protein
VGTRGLAERKILLREPERSLAIAADCEPGLGGVVERALATQAEQAYRRTIADWKAAGPTPAGAGVTPGRASQTPSKGKAARQTRSP